MKIQLKRSSILENGVAKEPTAGQMEYGELAVNYNENDISIFTKDSDNNIRRVGGSINKGSGEPENPGNTPGDWYFDITNGILFYWDGSGWQEVQAVGKLIAGDGIEITTATTGSTFAVDLAGGDDGLEFDSGKLKATIASESEFGVVKIGAGVIADDGVIKAKNTITVGENPPAINLKQGDLWWNSNEDNGRLYVYYEDENTQQWIDASPQGGNLEQDQADTLYLSKKNDDTAAGNITFDKNIYVKQTASIGGTAAAPKIELNATGSASFDAAVQIGADPRNGDNPGTRLGTTTGVTATGDTGAQYIFSGYNVGSSTRTVGIQANGRILVGGTLPDAPNITLNASGSAEFAAAVQVGGDPDNGTSPGSKLYPVGGLWTCRSLDTSPGLSIFKEGTTTANCQILADGSAEFAGDIQVGEYEPLINVPGVNILAAGAVTVNRTTGADGVWSGKLNRAVTSEIQADGSATFDGLLTVNEAVRADRTNPNQQCFSARLNGTANAQIFADGSATFAGDIGIGGTLPSAPNISLNAFRRQCQYKRVCVL